MIVPAQSSAERPRALIVDDDPEVLGVLAELVAREGFDVTCAATLVDARARLAASVPHVLLLDLHLTDGSGLDLLDAPGLADPEVVFITGQATVDTAVEALRRGASDYLTKPVDVARLTAILAGLSRTLDMKGDVGRLQDELRRMGRFGPLVGASPPMQKVYELIGRVAPTDATVLVTGETGTGKEIVAKTIHDRSLRRKAPFVAVDCGALSPTVIESELFGHERGSFTGADRLHKGCFERAHLGTLFLDEVGETSAEMQVKLLRVLETSSVVRLGGERPIPVNVRVVAATNRRPAEAVAAGRLREDLLYRLSVFPIELPALRERGGDVELLAERFLAELNAAEGKARRFTPAARGRLRRHSWPGNVRELRNAVQRSYILDDDELRLHTLACAPQSDTAGAAVYVPAGTPLADAERLIILAALERYGGDRRKTAAALKVGLSRIYARLRAYGAARGDPRVLSRRA